MLLGSLGGFETLGLLGLFVGPVALPLGGTLLQEWRDGVGFPAAASQIRAMGDHDGRSVLETRSRHEA